MKSWRVQIYVHTESSHIAIWETEQCSFCTFWELEGQWHISHAHLKGGGGCDGCGRTPLLDEMGFFSPSLRACYRGWWCMKIPLPRVWKIDPNFLRQKTKKVSSTFAGLARLLRLADLVQNPHPRFQKLLTGLHMHSVNSLLFAYWYRINTPNTQVNKVMETLTSSSLRG